MYAELRETERSADKKPHDNKNDQEMGTSKVVGKHYLKRAVEDHLDEYKTIIKTFLKDG